MQRPSARGSPGSLPASHSQPISQQQPPSPQAAPVHLGTHEAEGCSRWGRAGRQAGGRVSGAQAGCPAQCAATAGAWSRRRTHGLVAHQRLVVALGVALRGSGRRAPVQAGVAGRHAQQASALAERMPALALLHASASRPDQAGPHHAPPAPSCTPFNPQAPQPLPPLNPPPSSRCSGGRTGGPPARSSASPRRACASAARSSSRAGLTVVEWGESEVPRQGWQAVKRMRAGAAARWAASQQAFQPLPPAELPAPQPGAPMPRR